MGKLRRNGLLRPPLFIAAIAALAMSFAFVPEVPASAASGSVSNVTVSVAPAAAGFPGTNNGELATYKVSFIATDGITANGTPVTIVGSSGTDFNWNQTPSIADNTNPADSVRAGCVTAGAAN